MRHFLSLLVGLAFVLLFSVSSRANGLHATDVLQDAEGLWALHPESPDRGDYTCERGPLRIEINVEAATYRSRHLLPQSDTEWETADILKARSDRFLIRYRNEQRLDDAGRPVEWWFVLVEPDVFYWARADWPRGAGTTLRQRCEFPLTS